MDARPNELALTGDESPESMSHGENSLNEIRDALMPTLICQFAATGNVNELASILVPESGLLLVFIVSS